MREDHQEKLEEMFPDGYIIVYTCEDGQIRKAFYNPNKFEKIYRYYEQVER